MGPGDWKAVGRDMNPAGFECNPIKLKLVPGKGTSEIDYATNSEQYLGKR